MRFCQSDIAEDIKEIETNQDNMKVNPTRLEDSTEEISDKNSKFENVMKRAQFLNENVREIDRKVESLQEKLEQPVD